jgi:glycosyltransferase involved in cell wall biosynthesis
MPVDITALITLHREGCLAQPTLRSLQHAADHARAEGLKIEILVVLDKADPETRRVAQTFAQRHADVRLHEVQVGDLSLARNAGIAEARGRFLGTHDGDDLYSSNWLLASAQLLATQRRPTILHPELMVCFDQLQMYFWQFDQTDEQRYRPHTALMVNYWNACSFAERRTYLEHPYQVARVGEAGFGFEDWHWNCETTAAGFVHRVTPRSIRFERRKAAGSLNSAHAAAKALIRPSRFFETLEAAP